MTQQLASLVQIVGVHHRMVFLVSRKQVVATRGRYSKVILAEVGCYQVAIFPLYRRLLLTHLWSWNTCNIGFWMSFGLQKLLSSR